MDVVGRSRRCFLQAVAAAVAGLALSGWLPAPLAAAFRAGDVPSRFPLSDLQGNRVVVPSEYGGRVLLIHFWASWCPACRGEMAALEGLFGRHGAKGFVPCSIGLGEKRETAAAYLRCREVSYPVLLDPDSQTRRPFGLTGIPTCFVLDRRGVIRHKIVGVADGGRLEKLLLSLL